MSNRGSGVRKTGRRNERIEQGEYFDALLREIDERRRQELMVEKKTRSKIKNPELEKLRNMAITSLKNYSFFNTPQFDRQLHQIGPYKLDYCRNMKSHGTCNYGPRCTYYHDQNVEKLKTAILAIINKNKNRKERSTR